jgi:hypothetical protein
LVVEDEGSMVVVVAVALATSVTVMLCGKTWRKETISGWSFSAV